MNLLCSLWVIGFVFSFSTSAETEQVFSRQLQKISEGLTFLEISYDQEVLRFHDIFNSAAERSIPYPVKLLGWSGGTIFNYQYSILIETGKNFAALVDTGNGEVIKTISEPEGLNGRRFGLHAPLDKEGNRICFLSGNYVGVLDVNSGTWASFKEINSTVFSNYAEKVALTTDGQNIILMTAPSTSRESKPFQVHKVNCYNPEENSKLGEIPSLITEQTIEQMAGIYFEYQVLSLDSKTFIVSKSPRAWDRSLPTKLAKITINDFNVETESTVVVEDQFYYANLLVMDDAKKQVVVLGKGYDRETRTQTAQNIILDLKELKTRFGVPFLKQAGRVNSGAKYFGILDGKLVNVGWRPHGGWEFKSEILDLESESFKFL